MLRLLIDTSTWLDVARRRDGQRWIVTLRVLLGQRRLELLVPAVVAEEFSRNRARIETSMTAKLAERFRLIKEDLKEYAGDDQAHAFEVVEGLAHQVPLIGAMATRNFDDIAELLDRGLTLVVTPEAESRVVERGLAKRAPFHRGRNSMADALLIELYDGEVRAADLARDPHAFITSNSEDFSAVGGDRRHPHPDLPALFNEPGSRYALGVDGLEAVLREHFGEDADELFEESDFREDPRRLDEITEAEQALFDVVWYQRSLYLRDRAGDEGDDDPGAVARRQVEQKYGADKLGPYNDFEWGMLNGKLSALRWVLGSEWDFLDT